MFKRTEYVTKREGLLFHDWKSVAVAVEQLLVNGYQVYMTAKDTYNAKYGGVHKEYRLHFLNRDFDYETFEISDNYKEYEVDGVHYTDVRQRIEIDGFDGAAKMLKALLDNEYELFIWSDGETFGGTQPLGFVIEFVHMNEPAKIERVDL